MTAGLLRTNCVELPTAGFMFKYDASERVTISMAREKGRTMDSLTPRYSAIPSHHDSNDSMEGFDRVAKIAFLIALPLLGLLVYVMWNNGLL
jgi:hypothetical protein